MTATQERPSEASERVLPKIISVDDHVVEPPHVWQTWLPEKYRARGPRVERKSWGAFKHLPGRAVREDRGPRRPLGRRLVLRGPAHLRPQAVRRDPARGHARRRPREVRPHEDGDDRAHLRRDAARAATTATRAWSTSSATGSTARCRSPRSRASAARRSTKHDDRELGLACVQRLQRLDGRGVVRAVAAASTSRSASCRCGTSSSRRPRSGATPSGACARSASASCRTT